MNTWEEHPITHLRKVAMLYKKELYLGPISKMSKAELIKVLDKYLIIAEGQIRVKSIGGHMLSRNKINEIAKKDLHKNTKNKK